MSLSKPRNIDQPIQLTHFCSSSTLNLGPSKLTLLGPARWSRSLLLPFLVLSAHPSSPLDGFSLRTSVPDFQAWTKSAVEWKICLL